MLRSRRWFGGDGEVGLLHRAAVRPLGIEIGADDDRPVIGIANSSGEVNPCNAGLDELAAAVKRGVRAAGGIPLEFPTITLGEDLMKPAAMLYRNLMAMDIEECLRAYPFDGVVLLANCDKTVPAQLMGAASADLPAIMLTGGHRASGLFRGRRLATGTDLWRLSEDRRAGRLSDADWAELEACLGCSLGACNSMGTASTMAAMAEALGMMLPGVGSLPIGDPRLLEAAEATGRRAVGLVREDLRPSRILTAAAFDDAIAVLAAIGGSTNAVIHLCAIAGRRAIPLPLARFDEIGRRVPMIADVEPSGTELMDAFHDAGGVPTVLREIARIPGLIAGTSMTVTGESLSATRDRAAPTQGRTIRHLEEPVSPVGGIAVLRGNLAPDGAVLRLSTASPDLLRHRGPAVVFHGYEDMLARIDDPSLPVTRDSVLVLSGCGPIGVPGMPEWGMIPIPAKLARDGVRDMVRISDSRMSGTAFGTVVLHAAPEAAAGGIIGLVRDGDAIELDVAARSVILDVPDAEIARRRATTGPSPDRHLRGWPRLYRDHVLQAPQGCDLDFLVPRTAEELDPVQPIVGRS